MLEFHNEQLADGRTWSATFDSYDERHDDIYVALVALGEREPADARMCACLRGAT